MSEPSENTLVPSRFEEEAHTIRMGRASWESLQSRSGSRPPSRPPASAVSPGWEGLPERYTQPELLGRGGMGEVYRVHDAVIGRKVAMKVIRGGRPSAGVLRRFREEAQVAGQLQHPGIVPVHDLGELPDGRMWFTMKEVRGRTLGQLLGEVHHAHRSGLAATSSGFTFRRLLDAFLRVCEAVGYAHARGVVHRDLKPENVMIGDHGEVLVLDWGLARVTGDADPDVDVVRVSGPPRKSRAGAIAGTPAYMPPEQARGQHHRVGPWSDVYALGASLYDLLTERPPYPHPSAEEVLDAVIAAEPIAAPSTVATGHPVDEELDRITLKALSPRPEDRYPDATALAKDVAAWIDGATRRERALRVVASARDRATEALGLERRAALLARAARTQLDALPDGAGEEQKGAAWDLEDESRELQRQAEDARIDVTQLLRAALSHEPDLVEAHALLAEEYHRQHAACEAQGRREDGRAAAALLRAHDRRGRYAAYLRGEGAVTLDTDVPAVVELYRFDLVRRRLHPVRVRELGSTPLVEVPLPMGSWLLVLRAPGRVPVRYPILVERGTCWDALRPGGTRPTPVLLPRPEELDPDDVYVPGGWYWSSATLEVLTDTLPRRRLWCDPFVMRRFPVTNAEYVTFLEDLVKRGDEELALRCVPRGASARPGEPGAPMYRRGADGAFTLGTDAQGFDWDPRWPVVRMPWSGAAAFAAWSARPDRAWRLPMDLEWEKAARGVDDRLYPWGDTVDPTWSRMVGSPGRPGLVAVGASPADVSVYGVQDLAGNAFQFVADPRPGGAEVQDGVVVVRSFQPQPNHRYRGGAYSAAGFFCRSDLRRWVVQGGSDQVGFRIARSFSREG